MTQEQQEAKRRAEVMLAFADGAPVEWMLQGRTANEWQYAPYPKWDWTEYDYRVSPNPVVNWDAMPAWANWVANDPSGTWFWYSTEPTFDGESWCCGGRLGAIPSEYAPKYAGTQPWHELIIERPKK
jgi:hypothetical protein